MTNFLKKEFLLGIGTGFLISAILLTIYGTTNFSQKSDDSESLSQLKASVKQELQQEEQRKAAQTATTNAPIDQTKTANKPKDKMEQQQTTSVMPSTQPKKQASPSGIKTDSAKTVSFQIRSGMSSETISSMLQSKGVIKDSKEFYKLITAHHAHSKFKVGTWQLPVGGNPVQILDTLTSN